MGHGMRNGQKGTKHRSGGLHSWLLNIYQILKSARKERFMIA